MTDDAKVALSLKQRFAVFRNDKDFRFISAGRQSRQRKFFREGLHLRRSKINSVLSEVKAYSCLFQFIVPIIHFQAADNFSARIGDRGNAPVAVVDDVGFRSRDMNFFPVPAETP